MFIALDKDGNRISAENAVKGNKYFCPICREEVIVRQGEFVVWHFAHKAGSDCDDWHYDMSDWHRDMQNLFPEECQEVVVEHNGKKHRADVLKNNVVLEFQHSPISAEEYMERNRFWTSAGYRLAWIFDGRDFDLRFKSYESDVQVWRRPLKVLRLSPNINYYNEAFSVWFYLETEDGPDFEKVIWTNPDWSRILLSDAVIPLYDEDYNIEPFDFVKTKQEKIESIIKSMPHTVKFIPKMNRYWSNGSEDKSLKYTCPRRMDSSLYLYTEKGCSYCKYCPLIVKVKDGHNVYCTYPKPAREPDPDAHEGYECFSVGEL